MEGWRDKGMEGICRLFQCFAFYRKVFMREFERVWITLDYDVWRFMTHVSVCDFIWMLMLTGCWIKHIENMYLYKTVQCYWSINVKTAQWEFKADFKHLIYTKNCLGWTETSVSYWDQCVIMGPVPPSCLMLGCRRCLASLLSVVSFAPRRHVSLVSQQSEAFSQ